MILVDDGVATGATMYAAVKAVRQAKPREIVVAVPTSSAEALDRLRAVADRVVVISTPEPYVAVGAWYRLFDQLGDDDVVKLLSQSALRRAAGED